MQLSLLCLPETALKPGPAMPQQLQPLPQGILLPLQSLHPLQLEGKKQTLACSTAGLWAAALLSTLGWVRRLVTECEPRLTAEHLEVKEHQGEDLRALKIEWKYRGRSRDGLPWGLLLD